MGGAYLILVLVVAIAFIVVATSRLKIHPFIVLLLAAYLVAFGAGMEFSAIAETISEGFGKIMKGIGIVILLGTIIGVILEKSGAAIKLADMVLKVVGKKYPTLGLSIIGYIVSIPVFADSAYIILNSLKRSIAKNTGKNAMTVSIALAAGLMASHALVPPTPGPIAAAGNLELDNQLGLVIIFGLITAFIAMLAGHAWALYIGPKYT
ncbi:MAG: GntP family permease, partial [Bacteroidota bacterium]